MVSRYISGGGGGGAAAEPPRSSTTSTLSRMFGWDSGSSSSAAAEEPEPRRPLKSRSSGGGPAGGGGGGGGGGGSAGKLCCDRCDGKHETARCPHFKKERDKHRDAQKGKGPEMGAPGGNFVLRRARVVPQPGDGSCLFHSMSYGLGSGSASSLRREIGRFIEQVRYYYFCLNCMGQLNLL